MVLTKEEKSKSKEHSLHEAQRTAFHQMVMLNNALINTMGTEHTIDVGTWLHPVPKEDGSCCHSDCHDHISPCHRLLGGGAHPHGAADSAGKLHCLLLGAVPYPDLQGGKENQTKTNSLGESLLAETECFI